MAVIRRKINAEGNEFTGRNRTVHFLYLPVCLSVIVRYNRVMSAITQILSAIEQGDAHAAEQLLPLVYDELRKLATQRK